MLPLSPDLAALLLDQATDLISLHAPDGSFRWASGAARAILGIEPDVLVSQPALAFVFPDDQPLIRATFNELLHDPAAAPERQLTYRARHAQGHVVWMEGHCRALRDPATGTIQQFVAVTRDVTAREQAARTHAAEQGLLEAIFEESPAGISLLRAVRDPATQQVVDFEYLRRNRRARQTEGQPDDVLLTGKRMLVDYPSARDTTFPVFQRAAETAQPWAGEQHYRSEGRDSWFQMAVTPLPNDQLAVSWVDLTSARELEAKLADDHRLLEAIFATSPAGLSVFRAVRDATGAIVDFLIERRNARARQQLRILEPDEGERLLVRYPSARAAGLFDTFARVLDTATPWAGEQRYHGENLDGWYFLTVAPLDAERISASLLDLTSMKLAESRVAEAQDQLALAAEVAGIGLTDRVLTSELLTASPSYLRLFGLSDSTTELSLTRVLELFDAADVRDVFLPYQQAVLRGETPAPIRLRARRADDGRPMVVLVMARALLDSDGQPVRMQSVTVDLTATALAQAQAAEAQTQLALAAEVIGLGASVRLVDSDQLTISPEFTRIVGLPAGTTTISLPELLRHFDPTDVAERFDPYLQALLRGEASSPVRLHGRRADTGAPFTVLTSARIDPGPPARVQSALLDLTTMAEAEQQAHEAQTQLALAAEAAGLGLSVREVDASEEMISTNYALLFGFEATRRWVSVAELQMLMHPDDLRANQATYFQVLKRGEQPAPARFRIRRADTGEERMLFCTARLEPAAAGRPARIHTAVVDLTDLLRAEQATREAQTQLALAAEVAGLGLSVRDLKTEELVITPGYARLFGLDETQSRVPLASVQACVLEAEYQAQGRDYFRTLANGQDTQVQYRVRRASDGVERTLLTKTRIVRDSQGWPLHALGATMDVTDAVRVQQQAAEAQAQLLLATEVAGLGLSIRDTTTNELEISPAYARIYGLPADRTTATLAELLGQTNIEDLRDVRPEFDAAMRRGDIYHQMQYRIRRADTGEERTLVTSARALPGPDGRPSGRVVAATLDLTEVLRARAATEQLAFWRTLTDGLPEIMWVADASGRTTQINQRWYAYTGQTEADIRDDTWQRALHPADLSAPENTHWQQAMAAGQPYEMKFRLQRHDGSWRWHVTRAAPLRDETGAVQRWVGLTIDIHEQELAEQALRRANQDLDTFVYAAAHDLKSPIDNLEAILDALREEAMDRRSRYLLPAFDQGFDDLIDHAGRAVARFRSTLADLAQVVDLQRNDARTIGSLDLPTYVADLLLDMEAELAAAEGMICLDLRAPTVVLLPRHLRTLLFNLLANALKYRQPGRPARVWVRSRAIDEAWLELAVADNGVGLDAARATRAFELFGRLHPGAAGGTGIGLFIVRRVVEQAGGSVRVAGKAGVGTTFYIRLPVRAS